MSVHVKKVTGQEYVYFQHYRSGRKTESYIGRKDDPLIIPKLLAKFDEHQEYDSEKFRSRIQEVTGLWITPGITSEQLVKRMPEYLLTAETGRNALPIKVLETEPLGPIQPMVVVVPRRQLIDDYTMNVVKHTEKDHFAVVNDLRWATNPKALSLYRSLAHKQGKNITVICLKDNPATVRRSKILKENGARVIFTTPELLLKLKSVPYMNGLVDGTPRFNMVDDKYLVIPRYLANHQGPFYSFEICQNRKLLDMIKEVFDALQ